MDNIQRFKNCINWIKNNSINDSGIAVTSKQKKNISGSNRLLHTYIN